ncbi:uncharacterized protein LOC131505515 isoform X2 [Neofelis nebulosa]|uniref:uncharacterized protein LOC131505515 isoform X2 n=1 Tax=Neofelis nebulosa TaxID=61452 RepID=UPI00272C5EAD|nr:uncharacterized protein LOC131505515 isoform X2 [Neofelis nebulosa]
MGGFLDDLLEENVACLPRRWPGNLSFKGDSGQVCWPSPPPSLSFLETGGGRCLQRGPPPPPKLPGMAAGGTRRSHGTRGRGVPGGAQAYPRCLSFPLSRQRLLQRLGPVWALQIFEALPRTQFSLTLCNTVSWAGVVLPTLQKRKWRPPKGDAQPHRISDWYSEVPPPVDLCRPHPAAGQPGNFLNSATVSGLRPPGLAPPSVAVRGGSFQGEPDSSLLAEDVFLRSGHNISGTFRRGLNSLSTLAAFGVPGRAQVCFHRQQD